MFSSKLCTNTALSDLASRPNQMLLKSLGQCINSTAHPVIYSSNFDSQVQQILLYASEVGGLDCCDIIKNVHLFAVKMFLNVSKHTPNTLIYSETGRFPLPINAILRSVKYWLHILEMSHSRFTRIAYEMMKMRHNIKDSWYGKLKQRTLSVQFILKRPRTISILHYNALCIRIFERCTCQ